MIVLGIESSCDETAVAVVCDAPNPQDRILSHYILSQTQNHAPYGGVVPEVAARAHLSALSPLIIKSLENAKISWSDVDAIAATSGPGLMGGVLVGLMTAKALCLAKNKPFIAVNHLEGHALTPRLSHTTQFPYMALLASGGHCLFLEVLRLGDYRVLGHAIDDAAGEAFDKIASMMDLGFPGGPAVERFAKNGNPDRFPLPRPMVGRPGCDLSFSGLKTAARQIIETLRPLTDQDKADMAASVQTAITDCLVSRAKQAILMLNGPCPTFVVVGGVAANQHVRQALSFVAFDANMEFVAPPLALCTDNAAMIAWAGLERFKFGITDSLDTSARPRWPLDTLKAI